MPEDSVVVRPPHGPDIYDAMRAAEEDREGPETRERSADEADAPGPRDGAGRNIYHGIDGHCFPFNIFFHQKNIDFPQNNYNV